MPRIEITNPNAVALMVANELEEWIEAKYARSPSRDNPMVYVTFGRKGYVSIAVDQICLFNTEADNLSDLTLPFCLNALRKELERIGFPFVGA